MFDNTTGNRNLEISDYLSLLGKILDNSPYAILVTEVASSSKLEINAIYANTKFFELFQAGESDLVKENSLGLMKAGLSDSDFKILEQTILSDTREKKGFTMELRRELFSPLKAYSGIINLYAEVQSTGFLDSENSYSFIYIRDLGEKDLSSNNERFKDILMDNVHSALFAISENNTLIYFNNAARYIFGFTDTNLKKHISIHKNQILVTRILEIRKKLKKSNAVTADIIVWNSENNAEICLESTWKKVFIEGETIYISSNKDVSDERNLKKQILKDQRHQSLGVIAGGIAHDLNNLLTPVKLAADFLCMNENYNENNDHLEIISKASERASSLVSKILLFSGSGYTEKIKTDLRDLMSDLIKIIEKTFPKNIEVRQSIPSLLSSIESDPVQIQQVLLNICLNAKDAMPNGGILDIEINEIDPAKELCDIEFHEKDKRYICITIEDTGCGIAEQDRDKLYQPFFTTKKNGNGLGLATARDIIKEHNGHISFYSNEDVGTRFSVYLPVSTLENNRSDNRNDDEFAELKSLSMFLGNGEKILLVEDESSISRSLEILLQKYNYNVITASDGAEAIEKYFLNRDSIRLVIMDIILPCIDGLNVTRALKKYDSDLKIIGTSGFENHDTVKMAIKEIDRFLKKPYGTTDLLSNIKNLLN